MIACLYDHGHDRGGAVGALMKSVCGCGLDLVICYESAYGSGSHVSCDLDLVYGCQFSTGCQLATFCFRLARRCLQMVGKWELIGLKKEKSKD